jgi:hypothetical protein
MKISMANQWWPVANENVNVSCSCRYQSGYRNGESAWRRKMLALAYQSAVAGGANEGKQSVAKYEENGWPAKA